MTLMKPMVGAMIRACILEGEFYTATEEDTDTLLGFAVWMPPGHEIFEKFVF